MWYRKLLQIFKLPELRNKILFILAIFVVFRIMANIPIPGIEADKLRQFFESNQFFGLLNMFSGGALDNLSIVMLGVGPYITGTIILQLLTMIFPSFERLYKEEGERGRQKFNQYGRLLTIPLAMLQGYSMLAVFHKQQIIGTLSPLLMLSSLLMMSAGTMFLVWLGELISEKKMGNGISLLIFAGIIADFPTNIRQMALTYDPTKLLSYLLFFVSSMAIIGGVVLITEARRNIPVSYAKRVRGNKLYGGVSTYLPINVNPAGVIPIIFAISFLLFPTMIANFFVGSSGGLGKFFAGVSSFFQNPWIHGSLYFLLVFVFTFFYTMVTFEPKSIAENLQKMGGFIPGIRPGNSTADFLSTVLNKILVIGALSLGLIAIMPSIVQSITGVQSFQFLVGGTSLLIVVSVVLETIGAINAQLEMREYDTF